MAYTAVFTFGRMNPPTLGHEKLVNKVKSIAELIDANPRVYLSHAQDMKRNPLQYLSKYFLAREAFGSCVRPSEASTIIEVLKELNYDFDSIMMVVGSDRVETFETLLHKYNKKESDFKSIMVVSAGERDPDSDDVDGVSGTKLRQAAAHGDLETFEKGLATGIQGLSDVIMNDVRKALGMV